MIPTPPGRNYNKTIALLLLVSLLLTAPASAVWWSDQYDHRLNMTINSDDIATGVSNYPNLIHLSATSGTTGADISGVFDEVGADWHKIAVVDIAGNREYIEVKEWNLTAREAWLYSSHSLSSTVNTTIYLYYDADAPEDETYIGLSPSAAAEHVWDSDYEAVYHVADTNGYVIDSTDHDIDATINGATETSGGPLGTYLAFDGTNDYCVSTSDLPAMGAMTCEIYYNADVAADNYDVLLTTYTPNPVIDRDGFGVYYQSGGIGAAIGAGAGTGVSTFTPGATDYIDTSRIAIVYTGTAVDVNYDSAKVTMAYAAGLNPRPITIGSVGAYNYYLGDIYEVRFSSIARSDAWLAATYSSLQDDLISYTTETRPQADIITLQLQDLGILGDQTIHVFNDTGQYIASVESRDLIELSSDNGMNYTLQVQPSIENQTPESIWDSVFAVAQAYALEILLMIAILLLFTRRK